MNRERIAVWGLAVAAACSSLPALARDPPKPSLSIDPIVARHLLAPVEEARGPLASYRLDPGLEPAGGQRARLSVEVGDATVFALTGRLTRRSGPAGPLDPSTASALGPRRDSGKVYGAGISRSIGGIDLSAAYQYSKLRDEHPGDDGQARDGGPGKSHSLRGTLRIRFRP